ncbi:hypothetical protein V8F20_000318 [Naviculisporaceae sp. PSN 640]
MQRNVLLALLASIAAVPLCTAAAVPDEANWLEGGVTIPSAGNLTEGIYIVTIDEKTGEQVHTRLDLDDLPEAPPADSALERRQWDWLKPGARPQTHCGDGYVLKEDVAKLVDKFADTCDRHNGVKLFNKGDTAAVYVAEGTAVAYMCNWAHRGNPCRGHEWKDAVELIADNCKFAQRGVHQYGEVALYGWKKSYGYTADITPTNKICDFKTKKTRLGPGIKGGKGGINK